MPEQTFLQTAQDPAQTLDRFRLNDLGQFKRAGQFSPRDAAEYRTFYVGKDKVHDVLKYLLSRCSRSLKFNMFGYDDDELDQIIQHLITDDGVYVQGSLDKSQAGGVHEKKILATWTPQVRASFAIGESATHQITHTKGGVIDGIVAWEGSTNWSDSGEGTGKKAQNNTLLVHVNTVEVHDFATELDEEHSTILGQQPA